MVAAAEGVPGDAATLVTGGAGFIGSALVRTLLSRSPDRVIVLDALTYAGGRDNLPDDPRVTLLEGDVADAAALARAFAFPIARVLHLAAESHVDRSIEGPQAFVHANVAGTVALLEAARAHFDQADDGVRARFRFVHVSTDEVFGSLGPTGAFDRGSAYAPRSPYAASKAAADHFARAYHHTFGLPIVVTNCSNNFGPRQHPEKLIPHMLLRALAGETLPVYGDGSQVRDWLHVEDHARGLADAAWRGEPGATYLFGGRAERSNLALVHDLCRLLDERRPGGAPHARLIRFVRDRPGPDARYAIDPSATERALGWRARVDHAAALADTVDWYVHHEPWWRKRLRDGLERRG
jgi:dTDP-glucose 4,6-dehydratase